jgi:hypothetical protein
MFFTLVDCELIFPKVAGYPIFEDWVCRVDPEYILRIGMISIEPTYFLMPERDSHCWKHPQLLQVVVHSATE